MPKKSKLEIELVPRTCWGRNVRKVVSDETWAELRNRYIFNDGDWERPEQSCSICGSHDGLELHEVWRYDDRNKIQTLENLICICNLCHLVMHIGRSLRVGDGEKAIIHLMAINKWSLKRAMKYIEGVMDQWSERSQHKWAIDFRFLDGIISNKKIHNEWLEDEGRRFKGSFDAHIWAKEALESGDFLILDTETTGLLTYEKVEVIQIAIIDTEGNVLLNEIIKPKYKIPPRTTKIHGIDNAAVIDKPAFDMFYEKIRDIVKDKTIVAYKAEFDKEILKRSAAIYGLPEIVAKWQCAMRAYKAYQEFPRNCPLPYASHTALNDCRAVLAILKSMAENPNPWNGI